MILTQFRWDIGQIERLKNLFLGPTRHEQRRIARFLLAVKETVFVEPQPSLNGPLAHHDVVLLVPREISERERKFSIADNSQVRLNAPF